MTLKEIIDDFNREITSLREFVELISPVVKGNTLKTLETNVDAILPIIATITKQKLEDKIEELNVKKSSSIAGDEKKQVEKELSEQEESLKKINIDLQKYDKINLSIESIEEEGHPNKGSIVIEGDIGLFDSGINEMKKAIGKLELLYRSSFITLTSTCEFFLSRLLHYYYDLYPETAGIKDKSLTLEDLKSFESVKDAESFLIEKKVESVLRSELRVWFEILKKELSLGLGYFEPLKEELIECFQRRNVMVHNGGKVNSIYLSKVSQIYKDKYNIGDKLNTDERYLEEKICQIHLVFSLVAFELWKKRAKEDKERGSILIKLNYENMLNEKWNVSKGLSYFLKGDKSQTTELQTMATLNYWLSIKRMGDYDKIKSEVESADYSDKSAIFKIAISSLKEDKHEFLKFLPHALKSEDLSLKNLFEFPIFHEMRDTDEFKKYITENKIKKTIEVAKEEVKPKTRNLKPTRNRKRGRRGK